MKNHVTYGWIFDADGVLFDTNSISIEKKEIGDFLFQRLQKGEMVAINTGRTAHLALDKIYPELEKRSATEDMLSRFIVLGEKGAVMAYVKNGDIHLDIDETISIPDELREKVVEIVSREFSETMFEGTDRKESMISPEKKGHVSQAEYKKEQERLVMILQTVLSDMGLDKDYCIDSTKIAVDVQHKKVGKHFGASRILEWMREKGIQVDEFITFGDSGSDIEMAQEVQDQNLPVTFVYVGDTIEGEIDDPYLNGEYKGKKISFPLIRTNSHFSEGTSEYSQTFLKENLGA